MAYLLELIFLLRDFALSVLDVAMRRRRRVYTYSAIVAAPLAAVRAQLTASETFYDSAGIRILKKPHPDGGNRYISDVHVGDRLMYTVATEEYPTASQDELHYRYLREDCSQPRMVGEDDVLRIKLEAMDPLHTRVTFARELMHMRFGTRLTVPIGLRQAVWLEKTQAEANRPGFARSAPKRSSQAALSHLIWALAALASFWWLAGLENALILLVLVALHELGHAAAMLAVGVGVGFIRFIPFFGGMAAPKRQYESEWQYTLVALAGPGLSLIPTALLLWYALETESRLAANAAVLFAIVNGLNLFPVVPLDGGVIFRSIMGSIHPFLGRIVSWIGIAALVAAAVFLQSPLIGIVALFALWQVVLNASLDLDVGRKRLGPLQGSVMLIATAAVLAAYAALATYSVGVRSAFERFASGSVVTTADNSGTSQSGASCRLPATREELLKAYLVSSGVGTNGGGDLLRLLVASRMAGDERIMSQWLEVNARRSIPLQAGALTGAEAARLVEFVHAGNTTELAKQLDGLAVASGDVNLKGRSRQIASLLALAGHYDAVEPLLRQYFSTGDAEAIAFQIMIQAGELGRAKDLYFARNLAQAGIYPTALIGKLVAAGEREAAVDTLRRMQEVAGRSAVRASMIESLNQWRVRLIGPDAEGLPLLEMKTWSWWQINTHIHRAVALEAAGRKMEASEVFAAVDRAIALPSGVEQNPANSAEQQVRGDRIRELVEAARVEQAIDNGRFDGNTAERGTSSSYALAQVVRGLVKAGKLTAAERLEAGMAATAMGGPSTLWSYIPRYRFDPSEFQRLNQYARHAARHRDTAALAGFLQNAERQMCRRAGRSHVSHLRAQFLKNAYIATSVASGRLPARALDFVRH
ncbi:MAG: hypothetical protein RLZ98_2534 [Pseudomonadota bacterium]|jgi:Zn-dependent protease